MYARGLAGPLIEVCALVNQTCRCGVSILDSAMWSAKLKPIAKILPGRGTGGPRITSAVGSARVSSRVRVSR